MIITKEAGTFLKFFDVAGNEVDSSQAVKAVELVMGNDGRVVKSTWFSASNLQTWLKEVTGLSSQDAKAQGFRVVEMDDDVGHRYIAINTKHQNG